MRRLQFVFRHGMDFGARFIKKLMTQVLKAGDKLNHEGKEWTITEVAEDNE